ncbi:4-(cytidine 5'-diphospho)-2-C-methyl-D-erythritol kinase [Anderseniella sp. Alg231-50]|uniref:4-(cytidine 5'-diphospho)-2-C-methyl-D-erythritol kinase n=1 Tax=Anderseniella sp. Alg231-50 TaxID=1922226 RepID=UPI000D54E09D
MITEFAAAKINLALHVTGKRADGYHLLDSAVMFASDAGDVLEVSFADATSLTVSGPFSQGLETDSGNLVLRAFAALQHHYPDDVRPCAINLHKALPVASGIGGGSADAAAALRAIIRLNGLSVEPQTLAGLALQLGADVPVCVSSTACRMRGIGEIIDSWTPAPSLYGVLVNPLVGVSTAGIFRHLGLSPGSAANSEISDRFADVHDTGAVLGWLAECRNDLEPAACHLEPVIRDVLSAIARLSGCRLSRMSGSGATCFGLFEDSGSAAAAAADIARQHPEWWVVDTALV